MDWQRTSYRRIFLAVLACLVLAGPAWAQGNGPHTLPIIPKDTDILVAVPLWLSGNFNPSQTVLIPGADVDVAAMPLTYVRTFSLGGRFGRFFVTAPLGTLDGAGTVIRPDTGEEIEVSAGRSGWMDPLVTLHVGLIGAPALEMPEFVKHPKSFQMLGIVGVGIPIGTYDSDRVINLGINRWSFRMGVGTVLPFAKSWGWESENTVTLFTDNDDVYGDAETLSQDPLFISENHVTHAFNPKWWGSIDLRWQYGGETETDGIPDDNKTDIVGGGLSLGHQFTPHFSGYASYGTILIKEGDAEEDMIRVQMAYAF